MERKIDCPFCGKPKHLYINDAKGVYYCHKCNKSGKIRSNGFSISEEVSKKEVKEQRSIGLKGVRKLSPEDGLFWDYAKTRKALRYKDRLYMSTNFPEYLIIGLPLFSNPNFYFGRRLLLNGPRYRYFTGSTKGVIAKSFEGKVKEAVIVEGFFDMCSISKEFPTIALMSKAFDELKISKIVECVTKKVYIALDRDAFKENLQLLFSLSDKLKTEIAYSDIIKDPGENADWVLRKVQKR